MLFRRRHPPDFVERLRIFLWPRRSWKRSTQYVLNRLWRLSGSPHAIALGAAAGVFTSFTPFLGLHFTLAALLAFVIRGNLIASALGTFAGNPITFPVFFVSTYSLGNALLGQSGTFKLSQLQEGVAQLWDGIWQASSDAIGAAFDLLFPLMKPMTIGGIPLGIIAAGVAYFLIRSAVEAYQKRRRRKFLEKAGGEDSLPI